ncbi:MAG: N-formylglutamate amidohydrolase [Alphaproteobacteria bacterium]|nr:N-formylglutamate amidohydrolase [Alphaproteobacteria bacterium]
MPVLFDSPHSGANYPDNFDAALDRLMLRRIEDAFVDELFAAAPDYGATLIAARFPRGYVDPNRSHLDIDPAAFDDWQGPAEPTDKSRVGKGLIWTNLHGVEPLYARRLTGDEVRARIDNYWRPYHDAIAAAYERIHGEFGSVYHVNCHSMRAMGNAYDPDGEAVRTDFVISNHDGKSCSPAFLDLIVEYLRTANFDVAINDPSKGADLTRRYADPAAKRHSLQIEINRRLYMDEMSIEKNSDFTTLHNLMTGLVQAVCGFAAGRP